MGDRYVDFTNSLSAFIDFHLASIQNQLQMISPINDNHQYKEIIKSSKAKPKIFKPSVLIPVTEFNHVLNILVSPSNLINTFFAGKERDVNDYLNSKENIQVLSTSKMEEPIDTFSLNQTISITTESTTISIVRNSTNTSFSTPIMNSLKYKKSSKTNLNNDHNVENSFDDTSIPLANTTNNFNRISNINNPILQIITDKSKYIKHNFTSSLLNVKNEKKNQNIKDYAYSITSNDSLLFKTVEISNMENITFNENESQRKKRSFELFFNSTVQVSKPPNIIVCNINK